MRYGIDTFYAQVIENLGKFFMKTAVSMKNKMRYFSILAYAKITYMYVNCICIRFFLLHSYTIILLIVVQLEKRLDTIVISIPFVQLSSGLISLIAVTNAQLEIWLFTWTA